MRLRWWDDPGEGHQVLVPGLFGVGFVISLLVLGFDAIARLLPAAGKRRHALLARDAHGRANDVAAIGSGRAPAPGAVPCEARSRGMSALLGALAATVALTAVLLGVLVADRVGVDRQAWAITVAIVAAVPASAMAAVWLLSALLGPRSPRWLRALQRSYPLGTYPRIDFSTEF